MADKLVTSFRFTKENKKTDGLNHVFTNFIICRLTETTISKSHDIWHQSGETIRLLSWTQYSVFYMWPIKNPLLMHCHKLQQSTGSKKCHYCILSRETDRQCKGTGLNSCSSNTGADFTQHTQHAPFCREQIRGFYGIQNGVCFQCSARVDFGVNSDPIHPPSIKTASTAWNCD